MEALLFDSYRVFQKKYNGNIIRRFFKLPVFAIILFFSAIASVVGAITFTILDNQILSLVCVGVEALTGIATFFYTENYQLKTIDQRLTVYRHYCGDVRAWLSGTDFVVTPQNIQELLGRATRQIERQENSNAKKNASIRHVIDIILIPFLLAIFSLWMTGKTDLAVLITGALTLFTVVGTLGMIIYFVYSILSFYRKHRLEQWRCFADDLQGLLDTQFENQMIANRTIPAARTVNKSANHSSKRKKAENAGKPWSKEDDALLCEMYDAGCSKNDIAKHFMRTSNSISARLVKLGKIPNRASF